MCKSERASFSSAGPTAQVNSSPGVGFAQKATDDAAEVTTDDATAVATEEEATAVEVANSDEEKPGATKATVVATVSPLPKTTAYITVPAYCDAHTVNETHFGSIAVINYTSLPGHLQHSSTRLFFPMGTISSSHSFRPTRNWKL